VSGDHNWTPAFPGQRPPRRAGDPASFKPGNELAKRHGAYSSALDRHPRVLELAEQARATAPWLTPADESALRLWAMAVVRLELLAHVLLPPLEEDPAAIEEWARKVEASPTTSRDARGWHANAMRLGDQLGLTPAGRAAIEDRERTVVSAFEVKDVFTALFLAAAEFVADEKWPAFQQEVERIEGQLREKASLPVIEGGSTVEQAHRERRSEGGGVGGA
jgi:hypothetical protein